MCSCGCSAGCRGGGAAGLAAGAAPSVATMPGVSPVEAMVCGTGSFLNSATCFICTPCSRRATTRAATSILAGSPSICAQTGRLCKSFQTHVQQKSLMPRKIRAPIASKHGACVRVCVCHLPQALHQQGRSLQGMRPYQRIHAHPTRKTSAYTQMYKEPHREHFTNLGPLGYRHTTHTHTDTHTHAQSTHHRKTL